MFCDQCGAQIQDGSLFCSKCGAPVSAEGRGEAKQGFAPPRGYDYQPKGGYSAYRSDEPEYDDLTRPLRTGEYIVMMLLMLVPVGNLIFLILWACDRNVNVNKRSWAKATLIMMAIGIVIGIIVGVIVGTVVASYFLNSYPYYF